MLGAFRHGTLSMSTEAFSACFSLYKTHLCFYFHIWESQGLLYRKSDPELYVEKTPDHFPPVSTQKIRTDRNDAKSLDSWLFWPFCPEQVPK